MSGISFLCCIQIISNFCTACSAKWRFGRLPFIDDIPSFWNQFFREAPCLGMVLWRWIRRYVEYAIFSSSIACSYSPFKVGDSSYYNAIKLITRSIERVRLSSFFVLAVAHILLAYTHHLCQCQLSCWASWVPDGHRSRSSKYSELGTI